MDKIKKSGKVSDIELVETENSNAIRVEINTATAVNLDELAEVEDITSFLLSKKEQTTFSTLINADGLDVEKLTNALKGKSVNIVVCTESIEMLSNGTIKRVQYERNDGVIRKTRTMSRVYLEGQRGIDDAFSVLQDELRTRLSEGDFEVVDEEEEPKKEEKPKKPLTF